MASASIAIPPCHHGLTCKASDSMAVAADFYKKVVNAAVGIVCHCCGKCHFQPLQKPDVLFDCLIYHRCTHYVSFALPSRVQSVFWGPTSTSSHPADWWRQIWSSHSLCRQALLTFHCKFSHQCATCSTGRIVLQPFRTVQPPPGSVESWTHAQVFSTNEFTTCCTDWIWLWSLFLASLH